MRLTNVKLKDLKKIFKLELQIFKENAFSKQIIKEFIEKHYLFLKLEKGVIKKRLIGFIIVVKDRKDRANIVNFLINSKYHNKGFGSFILQETLVKIQSDKSIKYIVLNVKVDNDNAIHLYGKFNFKKIQKIENYYQDSKSSYLMQLLLRD
ncbi:MAG: GNAT family N-acetyltransferase [Promethearchaeota archaeon]